MICIPHPPSARPPPPPPRPRRPPPPPGLHWAEPSLEHLSQLMRHVVAHPEEAAARGAAARQRMLQRYSLAAVADVVAGELRRIEVALAEGGTWRQEQQSTDGDGKSGGEHVEL